MMPRFKFTSEDWSKRAIEARAIVEELHDQTAREMMHKIAEDYETLAGRAAQREKEIKN
jgi:serine phosphatase RsbU (regulator of sigma subunit)